jgi:hypothetical protein
VCRPPFLLTPRATGARALDPDFRSLWLPERTCRIVEQIAHCRSKSCTSTNGVNEQLGSRLLQHKNPHQGLRVASGALAKCKVSRGKDLHPTGPSDDGSEESNRRSVFVTEPLP